MPRRSKGPRLELQTGAGRTPKWIIRDGAKNVSTRCDECDREQAEAKLAEYILAKHDPAKAIRSGNPNEVKIADILAVEMTRIAAKPNLDGHRKKELIAVCQNMGNWFGHRIVGDLNGELQERYAAERTRHVIKMVEGVRTNVDTGEHAPVAAYRDLKFLAAAINRYFKHKVGGVVTQFSPVLPDAPESRVRWLTRSEAAKLLWAAWRGRKETKLPGSKGRHTSRHIARYILVGLYTGSRNGDICGAATIPTIGRGYVDLEKGIFRRKPDDKKETSKRQPTVPIPPRLLAHMRRWQRLGISQRAVIEFNGKPVVTIREGWESVVERAGLATEDKQQKVLRHTLRHTAITWYLDQGVDIEKVSLYCGVSVATIRKTYRHVMPGTFDDLLNAAHQIGR
ncbi:tyrosine-type recombinase/integrase [Bradyrhizobium sp. NBAIM14]|uniref:tyrosine-type recombinase/integrase n=1 Tax=Bradyrhizobium sp. NBAIM14 TaxID=2793814 RepID=UPI001CD4AAE2|nr:tyrosine-type recombinase/integrase [Bradyrhizobium sp. NBAIM14]MCA1498089.1 tyrosine-type recombinase/integrase [Bradyrhizobium sp. NBAIM14]